MLEQTHVKDVYTNIAANFSHTRYMVWEDTRNFLDSLPKDSTVLDAGCGNGKCMLYRTDLDCVGIDNCKSMVNICKSRGLDVSLQCVTKLDFPDNSFDAVICIAAIHHLETFERRQQAINELVRVVKKGGKVFISLWFNVSDSIQTTSNKIIDLNDDNYLIPWKLKNKIFYRYYHFANKEEIELLFKDYNYFYCIKYGNYFILLTKN
jgi:ubiquinone/menaquinone biosynthesis C-methylase UbiE